MNDEKTKQKSEESEQEQQISSSHQGDNNNLIETQTSHPNKDDRLMNLEIPDDIDPSTIRVVYVDPDTGDPVEATLDEMPEGAQILEIDEEEFDVDEMKDHDIVRNIAAERGKSAEQSSRTKKNKTVSFGATQSVKKSTTKLNAPNFHNDRNQRMRRSDGRLYVVPTTDSDLQGNIINRGQEKDFNVSPLTIFALAKNRKLSVERQLRRDRRKKMRQKDDYNVHQIYDDYPLSSLEGEFDHVDLSVEASGYGTPRKPQSIVSTDDGLKTTKDDVMKWCLNAFKKSNKQIQFPAKPSRPGSTQSIVNHARQTEQQQKEKIYEGMLDHYRNNEACFIPCRKFIA